MFGPTGAEPTVQSTAADDRNSTEFDTSLPMRQESAEVCTKLVPRTMITVPPLENPNEGVTKVTDGRSWYKN